MQRMIVELLNGPYVLNGPCVLKGHNNSMLECALLVCDVSDMSFSVNTIGMFIIHSKTLLLVLVYIWI